MIDFCLQELEALVSIFGVNFTREQLFIEDWEHLKQRNFVDDPTVYIRLPAQHAERLCSEIIGRSIMIKEIVDVFADVVLTSRPADELESAKRFGKLIENVDQTKLLPLLALGKKFKFSIEAVGRKVSLKEQVQIIELFKKFPFDDEDVSLEHPELVYKIIENTPSGRVYCGRQVVCNRADENSGKGKNDDTFYYKYHLKKRPYLGPTSTDHELAFLMANQAQIQPGDMVYDPFVGTGSIAVACQYFNACMIGSDLDMRVLKGYGVGAKTKNQGIEGLDKIDKFNIYTNFKHYKMPVPDFLAMDISALQFNMHESDTGIAVRPIFDSIVCDPPYGVRARSQKAGVRDSKKLKPKKEATDADQPYFGQKEHWDFIELHDHLLNIAATLLKPGGRLVFLFHTDDEQPPEKNKFPEHPSLQFVRSSKDKLTKMRARHLITMVKRLIK